MKKDIYKLIIIDDNIDCCDELSFQLKRYDNLSVEGLAYNGVKGRKLIEKVRPDLLFLDVELPDTLGMNLLNQIKDKIDWPMKVVFYTCYDKYMLDAIRSSAFDYLLKPFESDDLDAIISRFYTEMKDDNLEDKLSQVATINGGEKLFAIATPTDDIRVLRASDIGYFRYNSERKLWEVILRNNHSPLLLKRNTNAETIKHFDKCFVQIHQSYIININYLQVVKNGCCMLYPPFDNVTELQVSKKYKKDIEEALFQL